MSKLTTLIILPCHAIYAPQSTPSTTTPPKYLPTPEIPGPGTNQDDWKLVSFQLESQDQISFLHHVYKSIELLKDDLSSLLMISGGFTKSHIEKSESESYLQVAKDRGLLANQSLSDRIVLEECARDSFENILFSIVKYKTITGSYPKFIKIVGFEFKRFRFLNQHLSILQFPFKNVEYLGIGPIYPTATHFKIDEEEKYLDQKQAFFDDLIQSEDKFAVQLFNLNPFGSLGSKLHSKKEVRDPFNKESEIKKQYLINGDEVLNKMIEIDGLQYDDAIKVYNESCKDKFPWCITTTDS